MSKKPINFHWKSNWCQLMWLRGPLSLCSYSPYTFFFFSSSSDFKESVFSVGQINLVCQRFPGREQNMTEKWWENYLSNHKWTTWDTLNLPTQKNKPIVFFQENNLNMKRLSRFPKHNLKPLLWLSVTQWWDQEMQGLPAKWNGTEVTLTLETFSQNITVLSDLSLGWWGAG